MSVTVWGGLVTGLVVLAMGAELLVRGARVWLGVWASHP